MNLTPKSIRVRIAPSPTGYPHIGTVWQALINFAYARRFGGKFIVRIEDTDRQRLVADAEKSLFSTLKWFGLEPDESPVHGGPYGPYRQSERLDLYQHYAHKLVKEGKAYYCTCSTKRLAKIRQVQQKKGQPPMYDGHCRELRLKKVDLKEGSYVVRMKIPKDTTIVVDDLLRGEIKFAAHTIDDQVILKSDGYPTYHLAVVVDDHSMKISHMVRAEEWLPSAPKNWLLYDYLGWPKPVFVHTPTLRNPDRSKLSKRQGHTAASWYQERFLKEAILNYLGLLAWSHPQEKEIFDLKEFIKHFDLKDLSVSGPVFDINKLTYLNGMYIRQMDDNKLINVLSSKFQVPSSRWPKIIPLIKERIKDFSPESFNLWLGFFTKRPDLTPAVNGQHPVLSAETSGVKAGSHNYFKDKALAKKQLQAAKVVLEKCPWELEVMQKTLLDLVDQNKDWKRAPFFANLRIVITGSVISPPLIESMEILGKEECLDRIQKAINLL